MSGPRSSEALVVARIGSKEFPIGASTRSGPIEWPRKKGPPGFRPDGPSLSLILAFAPPQPPRFKRRVGRWAQLLLWPGTSPPAGAVVSLPLPISPLLAVVEPAESEFVAALVPMAPPAVDVVASVEAAAPLHCAAVGLAPQSVTDPDVVGASSFDCELSGLPEPVWA